ncbi:sigma-70 family RNA polymerase sigma factor [Cellulomonas sp. P22]|uniref:sigma-70 family RNA polymerase sigma factor n=1 Tax=Cellulomonas sp. P22 TaxID=3373189 RepID=UPI003796879B
MSSVTGSVDAERDFAVLTEPLRREITAHCLRMTGSVHDAEDLAQETYLRAWRSVHGFEHRASLRTWMFRIATNACLSHLAGRGRRPQPTDLDGALDAVLWGEVAADPATVVVDRESVRLAFVAALRHLTAQQRAVLLLRDVLAWNASEVAGALDLTVAGVNSTLQRARSRVRDLDRDATGPLHDVRLLRLLDAYTRAFEADDLAAVLDRRPVTHLAV